MKLKKSYIEIVIFLAVYLFTLYMWTMPFHDNKIPYGEFDAISHWELADAFAQRDNTFVYLPPFIDYSYGKDNDFKPHTLWYHPPFHTALAIISSFANDRMVPIYLTNAVFSSSIIVAVFFVIRKLFGFLPAILSAFMLSFSLRDINPYLWGQWPERFAYAFIPLVLYCFYKYYTEYSKESSKPVYLYIMAFLLAVNVMMHPLVFFHTLTGLAVLAILLWIKNRKIPFNSKHIGVSIIIFILLLGIFPYQTGNVLKSFSKPAKKLKEKPSLFARLFQWAPDSKNFGGSVPPSYFSFKEMHGLWTLPFLILGILVLFLRRENRDIFLLAWLISLYLILHRDLIGKIIFLHRSLSGTAHIFIPITVIGALSISTLIKLPKTTSTIIKYGAAFLVVALTLVYNMPPAYSTLDKAYDSPIIRLNPAQIEVSEWLKQNIPEDKNITIIGPWQEIMQKAWWYASYSHRVSNFFEGYLTWKIYEQNRQEVIRHHLQNDYLVMDYTDILQLGNKKILEQWIGFEQQYLSNHTKLYDKNNIKVYYYNNKQQ